jgi:hypothetical protein
MSSLCAIAALAAVFPGIAAGSIVHVRADALPGGDGASWETALDDLSVALQAAKPGDEIWVAAGTYIPGGPGGGSRASAFELRSGIAVYGGFAGYEQQRKERDPVANPTILSGDHNGDDEPGFSNTADNSFHVVIGSGTSATARLDGFVVTGGFADGVADVACLGGAGYGQPCGGGGQCTGPCASREAVGGGILVETGNPTIAGCRIAGNFAAHSGGGLVLIGFANPFLDGCVFENNEAQASGGAVFAYDSRPVITGCTFQFNLAGNDGGAIAIGGQSQTTLMNCSFASNGAATIQGAGGGAIHVSAISPTVQACTFSNNAAPEGDGGDLLIEGPGSPSVSSCTFEGGSAIRGGAVAFLAGAGASVLGCTFTGGSASAERGGIAYVASGSAPTFDACTLSGGSASLGGGLCIDGGAPTLTDCLVSGCMAIGKGTLQGLGGALYNADGVPELLGCTLSGNSAEAYGGVLYSVGANAVSVVTQCILEGNNAGSGGAGIYNGQGSRLELEGCCAEGQSAGPAGGAAVICNQAVATIMNCRILGNSAAGLGGALLASSDKNLGNIVDCTNCLFAANAGGALRTQGTGASNDVSLTNCTVTGDGQEISIGGDGGSIGITNSIIWDAPIGPSAVWITYSDVQGGFAGEGNIDTDPMFLDPSVADYRLKPDSPCIDRGNNGAVPMTVTTDLAGNPRFVDEPSAPDGGKGAAPLVDIGAYEFQSLACPGDLDGDGAVSAADLVDLLAAWGSAGGDLDGDGTTTIKDLLVLLTNWGPCG